MTTAWIILTTIACYFALLVWLSWLRGRRADNAAFFTGGRSSSWLMATLAMIGASISGVTFISVPGAVGTGGYAYMQMVLGFFVGAIVVALVLIPLFYRMNLTSIYTLDGEGLVEACARLLADIVCHPAIENGRFDPAMVATEKNSLLDTIAAEMNDKRSYAVARCTELLFEGEPLAVKQ